MNRSKRALDEELDDADDDDLQPVPKEGRTFAARLCDAFVQEEGDVAQFLRFCRLAGYRVTPRTLRR